MPRNEVNQNLTFEPRFQISYYANLGMLSTDQLEKIINKLYVLTLHLCALGQYAAFVPIELPLQLPEESYSESVYHSSTDPTYNTTESQDNNSGENHGDFELADMSGGEIEDLGDNASPPLHPAPQNISQQQQPRLWNPRVTEAQEKYLLRIKMCRVYR